MNRRNFLKMIGACKAMPEKKPLMFNETKIESKPYFDDNIGYIRGLVKTKSDKAIGYALEDIPIDHYGWVQLKVQPLKNYKL